jgi:hypothetical protein
MSNCGCFRGGDCTKTTLCALENAAEEKQDILDRLSEDAAIAIQSDFEHGVSWLSAKAAIEFRKKYPALHAIINELLEGPQ